MVAFRKRSNKARPVEFLGRMTARYVGSGTSRKRSDGKYWISLEVPGSSPTKKYLVSIAYHDYKKAFKQTEEN